MEASAIWDKVLLIIKDQISSTIGYNVHIKSAVPVSFKNGKFILSVPMSINKNMIDFRYKGIITSAIERITGERTSLELIVGEAADEEDKKDEEKNTEETQHSSESDKLIGLNPKYTFENFVVGASNQYAATVAISATERPGHIYNPLFLYGNSGLGKTHLMQAVGNRIHENNPDLKIVYVSSERFTNEFIESIRDQTTDEFRKKYRVTDVFLIDDVQFIENKEATQEEIFHTFNDLYSMNKQIVLTSDRKPSDLITLEERLRTRFGQGLTIDISVPNFETRVAILQKKAELQNVKIDQEVYNYVAENIKSNIRELEGALLKIISKSQISDVKIDVAFAEEVLKSILPEDGMVKITPEKIMERVAIFYKISIDDLTGKARTKQVAMPRQVAMYLCNKLTDMNFGMIGKVFGGKDRTTVMHNVNKIGKDLEYNESLKTDINYIIKDLENK